MKKPASQPVTPSSLAADSKPHKDTSSSRERYIQRSIIWYIAYRNLMSKKLRSALTIAGVVIGIGAIVFLVSLGLGLQKLVTEQVVNSNNVRTLDVSSTKPKAIHLDDEAIRKFRETNHVEAVARNYSSAGKITIQTASTDGVVNGVDQKYLDLNAFRKEAGANQIGNPNQVIVNTSLLESIGLKDSAKIINQKLKVKIPKLDTNQGVKEFEAEYTIIGVVKSGSGIEVFLPADTFSQRGVRDASQVKLLIDNQDNVAQVRKSIESQGYTTTSPIDTLDQINQVFSILNVLLASFGAIGMVIAILGMVNTLTISLLERTREIGLLVSLGARKKDVRRLFVIEALLLSLIGGVVGLCAAWTLGRGINLGVLNLARSRGVTDNFSFFYIPAWLVLATLLFITVIGLAVAFFPARRASRISPIDALRHD